MEVIVLKELASEDKRMQYLDGDLANDQRFVVLLCIMQELFFSDAMGIALE